MVELQQSEILTNKKRSITVELSDEDSLRIFEKCTMAGFSVSALVQQFIQDLVDSNNSYDSTKIELAERWFQRCETEKIRSLSFMQYLYELGDVDYFLRVMAVKERWQKELQDYYAEREEYDEEDISFLNENIRGCDGTLKCYVSDYLEVNPSADMEKEIHALKDWNNQREKFLQGISEPEECEREGEALEESHVHRQTKIRR